MRPRDSRSTRRIPDQFSDREAKLTHVFHLATAPHGDEWTARQLGPIDAFTTLVENTYRGVLLDGLDRRTGHFELASRAAGTGWRLPGIWS